MPLSFYIFMFFVILSLDIALIVLASHYLGFTAAVVTACAIVAIHIWTLTRRI